MTEFITDLLQSPPWVIAVFIVVYTLILAIVVWKISGWYKGISGWNKHRATEKTWKEKVHRLEMEIEELKQKLHENSSPKSKK